jgi:hypothetical protein
MQKNFDEFSVKEAMRLANTDLGQQLMEHFRSQNQNAFQNVMQGAQSGDLEQAKRSLAALLNDPKAKELLQKLQEEYHGRNGR